MCCSFPGKLGWIFNQKALTLFLLLSYATKMGTCIVPDMDFSQF